MNFSLQQPATPAATPPSVATDLPGVENPPIPHAGGRKRRRRRLPLIVGMLLLGTAGVVVATVPSVAKTLGLAGNAATEIVPFRVQKTKLAVVVKERGNLESAKNEDVKNEVEGSTTIIKILPEGTRVKKGEEVCVLDSATLKDSLLTQEVTTKRADADYANALKTREVAQISVEEYREGTYPQEVSTVEGEITLARSDLARAKDRLAYSKEMLAKKYVSASSVLADELSFLKAQISYAQAIKKMEVLQKYTKDKETTELDANVKKAQADELAKKSTFLIESEKLEKLKKQISKCVLLAPNDGLLVYFAEQNQFRGNSAPTIEEGAAVRERQTIFSLPDISKMQVNTKIHESMIMKVAIGKPAKVRVESNSNMLVGKVTKLNPLPDQGSWMSSDVKMYTAFVAIDNTGVETNNLRPGMSAEVEILINTKDDVLAIPVQSILQFQGKNFVYLLTPEAPKRVEVTTGIDNDKLVEILTGLKEGDQIAMNPSALMTEDERREAFNAQGKGQGKGKEWSADQAGSANAAVGGLVPKGAGGAPAGPGAGEKGKGKGGAGKGKRAGGASFFAKLGSLPEEERTKLRDPSISESDREALLKKAGLTDAEITQMKDMMKNGPPGGGGGGGPGGGGPPQ